VQGCVTNCTALHPKTNVILLPPTVIDPNHNSVSYTFILSGIRAALCSDWALGWDDRESVPVADMDIFLIRHRAQTGFAAAPTLIMRVPAAHPRRSGREANEPHLSA